jgi:multicomponent Na+:H+ antiporter subunit C
VNVQLAVVAGSVLVALGLGALLLASALMRKLLAFNVMGGGVFLLLLALASRTPQGVADPIAQALVLTGIVVAIAATALGLLLTRRYHAVTGRSELPDEGGAGDPSGGGEEGTDD